MTEFTGCEIFHTVGGLCLSRYDFAGQIAVQRESQLVIGIDAERGAIYAASDIPAFLSLTRMALILNDNELAVLILGEVEIFDLCSCKPNAREPYEVEWSIDPVVRGG